MSNVPTPSRSSAMAGRHVLIVSLFYWPEETGIAPYSTAIAEHLVSRGARVSVITAMPSYPKWTIFEEYRGRWVHREERNGVGVLRYRHFVPKRQTAISRGLYELSYWIRTLFAPAPAGLDLVLGVIPSLSAGALAAAVARRRRVPFGLMVQDLVGPAAKQSGIPLGGLVANAARAVETHVVQHASMVSVATPEFCPYLETIGVPADQVMHLPNWSHIRQPQLSRDKIRAELGWDPGVQVVLHAGNMGFKQGLENVINAARIGAEDVDRKRLFVLMGDGNQRAQLQSLAADVRNVVFLEPQPADRFSDVLAAADVLLVNERQTVLDMSLPSKLTSYFIAGRPVLAAVNPTGATALELERADAGLVVPPAAPIEMLAALDRLAEDDALCQQFATAGYHYAQGHLSEQAGLYRVEGFLNTILERSSTMAQGTRH